MMRRKALTTTSDVCESMKQQLLAFIQWAKHISHFSMLSLSDRIALVREHACEYLLLQAGYRLLGANDLESTDPIIALTTNRFLNELIVVLRQIQMDDSELVLLKAIMLINPGTGTFK